MPLSVLPRGNIPSQSSAIRAVPSVSVSLFLSLTPPVFRSSLSGNQGAAAGRM